jgi:2-polyprenyl-6-methoxyphenol hydroxylase-like FAD-dependent oxidoreductase
VQLELWAMMKIEHEVVIAGAGPTGLMLAGELALAGVDVVLIERRPNQDVEGSRAGGFHSRALELLDQRGIAERFIAQGEKHYVVPFGGALLDASDRPSRHNYTLGLWQAKIERGLADWVNELSVPLHYGREVVDFTQDDTGVSVALDDGRTLRAQYLIACDGGRSRLRKKAGIEFSGWEPAISYLVFEAEMSEEPVLGLHHGERGVYAVGRLEDGKRVRGVVTEPRLERDDQPTLDALREALIASYGKDFGVHNVTWLSRFSDAARQASAYRERRVLLAGDSAHVHPPVGGQGLNIGLQDAVNLGWKLAQVIKGFSSDDLLDTYHTERHPVGAAVLKRTLALTALNRGDARTTALREMMGEVMKMHEPRQWFAAMIANLDVRYDCGEGHALLGRRMPDLDLMTAEGPTRLFALLHDARPILLNFGEPGSVDLAAWAPHVKSIHAQFTGVCELPIVGVVPMPRAVLIRPDGHVAWVGEGGTAGLRDALRKWCGAW